MELRQLRSFLAVVESRNFTAAATALRLTQPALSTQIRQLEKELGGPLFDRTSREVRITAVGEAFLGYAQRAIFEINAGKDVLQELLGLRRGVLRVGTTNTFLARLIPEVTATFCQRYPEIDLSVSNVSGPDLREGILSGRYDLGVTYTVGDPIDPAPAGIGWDRFLEDEMVAAVPEDHPLAGMSEVRRTNGT